MRRSGTLLDHLDGVQDFFDKDLARLHAIHSETDGKLWKRSLEIRVDVVTCEGSSDRTAEYIGRRSPLRRLGVGGAKTEEVAEVPEASFVGLRGVGISDVEVEGFLL